MTAEDFRKKKLERVMVYLRVRPISEDEMRSSIRDTIVDQLDKNRNSITVKKENDRKQFIYDGIFDSNSSQKEVYSKVGKPVLSSVLEGYNGTILAYGQTGTGKTHTMIGSSGDPSGIIPRCMKSLFSSIKSQENHSFSVKVGFLQLYMEVLQDLVKPDPSNPIKIREDTEEGVYLSGVTWVDVHSVNDCMNVLATGDRNRSVASTNMNVSSSRSHAVYMVKLEKRVKVSQEDFESTDKRKKTFSQSMTKSTLYLVDLAGSERVSKTKVSGSRLDEAKNINLALLALGNCIQALTENKNRYIPFRDSKLTRLLEDSLGGNSKTTLIVTIGPSIFHYHESISSLLFGGRAMKIQNAPEVNIKIDYKVLCAQLQAELDKINDNKNIKNIDIDKVLEENSLLKAANDKLTSEKIQLEAMLEEIKRGSDVSIVEGSTAEFQKVQRHYRNRLEKQELEHKRFMEEIDKMLLDQEEQINYLKTRNTELENESKFLANDLKKSQNEAEKERTDKELRLGELINEIEDLKAKWQTEKNNLESVNQEFEKLKGGEMKKSNSANLLQPIKIKPNVQNNELTDRLQKYEVMIANLEEELVQYDRKFQEEIEMHKNTRNAHQAQIEQHLDQQKKQENEIKKLKKQQAKLIKAFKTLEKKSEEEVKSLQEELEKQSVSRDSRSHRS